MLWLTQQVSRSTSFPGGEHVACYLTSVGYSQDEIRNFYRAIGSLARGSTDQEALSVVTEVIKRFENFM